MGKTGREAQQWVKKSLQLERGRLIVKDSSASALWPKREGRLLLMALVLEPGLSHASQGLHY